MKPFDYEKYLRNNPLLKEEKISATEGILGNAINALKNAISSKLGDKMPVKATDNFNKQTDQKYADFLKKFNEALVKSSEQKIFGYTDQPVQLNSFLKPYPKNAVNITIDIGKEENTVKIKFDYLEAIKYESDKGKHKMIEKVVKQLIKSMNKIKGALGKDAILGPAETHANYLTVTL